MLGAPEIVYDISFRRRPYRVNPVMASCSAPMAIQPGLLPAHLRCESDEVDGTRGEATGDVALSDRPGPSSRR